MLYKVAQLILTTYDIKKKKKETHSVNLLKGYKTLFVGAKLDRLIYGNCLRVKIRKEHANFSSSDSKHEQSACIKVSW